jgi:hypothetical protein
MVPGHRIRLHAIFPELSTVPTRKCYPWRSPMCGRGGDFVLPESDLFGGHDGEHIPCHGLSGGQRSGGKLDDAIGADRRGDSPGPDASTHLHHGPVGGNKRNVDGKAHKEGVNRAGRRNEHRGALRERAVVQQTNTPAFRIERRDQRVRDNAAVARIANHQPALWLAQKRPKEGAAHCSSANQNSCSLGNSVTRAGS